MLKFLFVFLYQVFDDITLLRAIFAVAYKTLVI